MARWVLRRQQAEQELDDELQTFVEMAAAEKVRRGVPPAQARRLALLELGGVEQAKERVRTGRHGAWLDEVARDITYACRIFVKHRGFTAVVVLTLAIGIGANTAIFSLIDALMLRSLPVHNPRELVQLTFQSPGDQQPSESVSYAMVRALSDEREIFGGAAGFSGTTFDVGAPGAMGRIRGALVTGDFYTTLGLQPVIGRLLTRADDEPGAPLAAVISHGYWERRFARRAETVGDTLLLNGVTVAIVGVSPAGFVGANVGAVADVTLTIASIPQVDPQAVPLLGPGNFWLRVLARPRVGLSAFEAQARISARWRQIAERVVSPRWSAVRREEMASAVVRLSPGATGWTYLREIYAKPLLILMAVVGVVLLIACANVASLLLARASARQREVAVRMAIGASRGRIIRQLLIESSLLSLTGATISVGLAWLSGNVLVDVIASGGRDMSFDLTPNLRVLGFTTGVAVFTALLFGVAPAIQATALSTSDALKDDTRASTSRSRLLPSLVSAQIALSMVLLVGALLFARTLQNLQNFDPGFRRDGVLIAELAASRTTFPEEFVDEVRGLPGVTSASLSTHTPLSGAIWSEPAVPAGQTIPENDNAFFVAAGPEFFATMQIPMLSGREFSERDTVSSAGVAIVNERYARQHFADRSPLGEHLAATVRGRRADLEIIGVVKDTSTAGLRTPPPATVYVAYTQLTGDFPTTLEIRAAGSLNHVASSVRQILQARLPNTVIDVRPLSTQVESTMVRERMMATLAGSFGAVALILSCIGLYGLMSYRVAQRTKEIGIRMAVGAQRRQVMALVLRGAASLVLIGVTVGVPVTWAASRWIESMLFGLGPSDPVVVGRAIATLLAVAMLAASLPAWRASRVDLLPALRHE
jgi:predicted permease